METEVTIIETVEVPEEEKGLMANLRQVQDVSRNVVLAYAGFWGMAYDEVQSLLDRSKQMLDRAEDKGEHLEQETRERVRRLYEQMREEAEEGIEEQVEAALDEAPLPTERDLQALSAKIDALSVKIDQVVMRETLTSKQVDALVRRRMADLEASVEALGRKVDRIVEMESREVVAAPLPNYDELTAKEVVKKLRDLTVEELVLVRQYEAAHEDRVTVLREVDARIEEMPIANYDQLTVDEIEPLLANLTDEELKYLVQYEEGHEGRVTLLEALERELAGRA